MKNQSVIINAVCGAGKTELVYESIEFILKKGGKIAFAIPRKDVVIEIYHRLKKDYPSIQIACVYGGNTSIIEGQIVVLTTHQLYRYSHYFDLLILDEADAFPYYGNDLLKHFLKESTKGPIIYLSATIKDSYKKECANVVYVNKRFHNKPLPVPVYIKTNRFTNKSQLKEKLSDLNRLKKQVLIFVPTIECGMKLQNYLQIPFVYSYKDGKEEIIEQFKSKKFNQLITTSILERGITIEDVQVIVFQADHKLYDCSSLIQIAGRVGRKIKAPKGNVYFLGNTLSGSMKQCIQEITQKNKALV